MNINEVLGNHANNTTWSHNGETINFKDDPDNSSVVTSSVTLPTHESGKMGAIGTVFGGGNAAEVKGSTNVNIGTLTDVYIAVTVATGESVANYFTLSGDGTTASPYVYTAATGNAVAGTTYYQKITVLGADIRNNVFGGGNQAKVTGDTNVVVGK